MLLEMRIIFSWTSMLEIRFGYDLWDKYKTYKYEGPLSVFCQVFCYFCRNAKKCPLLSFMRILSMEPSDRWNMSFSFFGKPYFCLQHAIIQCYLFTVEIFFKHCEELVFSSAGLTFNCTVMKYLNRELQRVDRVVCFGWGGIPQKRRHSTLNDQRNVHTYTQQAYFK